MNMTALDKMIEETEKRLDLLKEVREQLAGEDRESKTETEPQPRSQPRPQSGGNRGFGKKKAPPIGKEARRIQIAELLDSNVPLPVKAIAGHLKCSIPAAATALKDCHWFERNENGPIIMFSLSVAGREALFAAEAKQDPAE